MAADILQQPCVALVICAWNRMSNVTLKRVLLPCVQAVTWCHHFVAAWPLNHEKRATRRMDPKQTCTQSVIFHLLETEVDAFIGRLAKHQ
jgi:hypothetical protein